MSGFCEAPPTEEYYYTTDPIQNFKIRVKIYGTSDLSKLPEDLSFLQTSAEPEFSTIAKLFQNQVGERQISWQERILSPSEYERYKLKQNCQTPLESSYHGLILKHGLDARSTIFTHTESDPYTQQTRPAPMTTSRSERPVDRRGNQKMSTKEFVQLVDQKKEAGHAKDYTTMYVMLESGEEMDQQAQLCRIQYYNDGRLSMKPDFNGNLPPYKINGGTMGIFAYTIEDASQQPTKREKEFELKLFKSLYNNHVKHLSSLVGFAFDMPPTDSVRIMCCGEIMSAVNFEFDHFCVNYVVDLADDWRGGDNEALTGSTQISKTRTTRDHKKVAYFSSPFEFELIFNKKLFRETTSRWPRIFFEVQSMDRWGRVRTEGYGTSIIPYLPGIYEFTVNCFRPLGREKFSELRRFFVGGSAEIDDITTTSIPADFKGKKLNKNSLQTVSTGKIEVRLQSLHQTSYRAAEESRRENESMLLNLYRVGESANSIFAAIEAFRQLRRRMLSIREDISFEAPNLMLS